MRYFTLLVAAFLLLNFSLLFGAAKSDVFDTDSVAQLRELGPKGLETILAAYDERAARTGKAELSHLTCAVDAIAMQRDAVHSRLYWYTDFAKAQLAAKASGKPILSLRLLGTLDAEKSCANSRFFRTVLYTNKSISSYLRENYILHWQSVRPVPVITIDMGDGRKIERTITGNSVHYILSPDGKVLDALPGLYAPATFLQIVRGAHDFVASGKTSVAEYQKAELQTLKAAFAADTKRAGVTIPLMLTQAGPPTAKAAGVLAIGKGKVEAPLVAAATPGIAAAGQIDNAAWSRIAALHAPEARLDNASIRLMESKTEAVKVQQLTASKAFVETPLVRIVNKFQRSIAEDTVRNQYLFRTQTLQWLIDGAGADLVVLNERVYSELFLTPSSDPWLGLVPADTYSALENDGLISFK